MVIIIGLGNPGKKFEKTRHNIGFMTLDKFAEKNGFPEFKIEKKYAAKISKNNDILLAKPQTFMNESGKTARKLLKQNKENQLIVVHDDIDLPLGKIKIVQERGSAGHKGVESIIKTIGNEGLIRIRVGIAPQNDVHPIKYREAVISPKAKLFDRVKAEKIVLKSFFPEEQNLINQTLNKLSDCLDALINHGLDKAMNEYNK